MAEEPEKTWQWVTVDDYEKLAVPTTIKIKKWWKKFVRWVTPEQEHEGEEEQSQVLELSFDTAAETLDDCFSDYLWIMTVNSINYMPSISLESFGYIFSKPPCNLPINRDTIIVIEGN